MAASMGIQSDTFWDFFHQATADGLFLTGEPISGSIPVLKRLAKKYRVRIITHKHLRIASSTAHAMRDTISFYEGHGLLQNVELIFPQSVFHKQGFPAEVVIDDKPDLGWAQDGAVNILFDQPWNEEVELQEGMVRAYDWSEVETIVNTTYADWKQMRGQVDRALSEARN